MSDDAVASGIVAADTLQQFVDVHTAAVDEGRVHFNDAGLRTSVVDPANVAMHTPVELSKDAFEHYDAPGAVTLGVNFNRLDEILGVTDADTLVEFSVNMETRRLELRFDGVEQDMALIDPDAIREEPDTNELDLANEVVLEGRQIDRALTVADLNSDHLEIKGLTDHPDGEVVAFVAEGDTDSGRVAYRGDDVISDGVTEGVASIFSLDYWEDFTKAIPADAEVVIRFGDEFPVQFSWESADGDLSVNSMIAPRIQSK